MLILASLLLIPSDVVLAGLSTSTTTTLVKNDTANIVFTTTASGLALTGVKLFGSSGTSNVGFTLRDSAGTLLADGGTYLNVAFTSAGNDLAFGLNIPGYTLQANTQYTLAMAFSSGSGGNMYVNDAGLYQASGWTENAGPGIKYSLSAAAVPEPGTLFLGVVAAIMVGGLLMAKRWQRGFA